MASLLVEVAAYAAELDCRTELRIKNFILSFSRYHLLSIYSHDLFDCLTNLDCALPYGKMGSAGRCAGSRNSPLYYLPFLYEVYVSSHLAARFVSATFIAGASSVL